MKLFYKSKDGGPDSTVTGYWLIEWKRFFSIAILRFDHGSREEFHSHAFNCISWILNKGCLMEETTDGQCFAYQRSLIPIITRRSRFHRVFSEGTTWVLTFRGPWKSNWLEYSPETRRTTVLTHGRKVVEEL